MPVEKADAKYLWDMLDAAKAIQGFVSGRTFMDYSRDRMLRNAVERNLEIIGEAANKVSTEFKALHGSIPWRGIVGQRNVIAHDYGDIKHEKVWLVAIDLIPNLVLEIQKLIPDDPD